MSFPPLLHLIQCIKMPLRISQPGRLQSSIGPIGSRLIGLPGLPLVPPAIWSPWAPNTTNICWAPEISWAPIASKQKF